MTERIVIVAPPNIKNKMAAIRAIRALTSMGLKESKDASERPGVNQIFALEPSPGMMATSVASFVKMQINFLEQEGFIVGKPIWGLIEELQKIGELAILQNEHEFADEIMQLVVAEKLRRSRSI